jgi:uncharacterized protein YndB with AHSA1/START domain
VKRTYPVQAHQVFHAWADPGLKARWFAGDSPQYELDFRPDGIERSHGDHDGKKISWESLYREIVPDERIVYTSVLSEDDRVVTASLTTVEFTQDGPTTSLVLTETGAYLDGREQPAWREQGTSDWLDSLGRHLAASVS